MTAALAIARREVAASFLSPVGWLVTALFLFFVGSVFFIVGPQLAGAGFAPGRPASMRLFFEVGIWAMLVVAPATSSRLLAEEIRLGTLETLMTSPIRESTIIWGKFLGAMGTLVVMLAPTLIFIVALERYGRPDYGEIACGYAGLLLVGAACTASGLLASSMTGSQVLAYLLTTFAWLVLLLVTIGLPVLAGAVEAAQSTADGALGALLGAIAGAARVVAEGNPVARMRGFVIGLVDSFGIVYFLGLVAVFLFGATRSLGLRRWP